jgi:hypothetical protein
LGNPGESLFSGKIGVDKIRIFDFCGTPVTYEHCLRQLAFFSATAADATDSLALIALSDNQRSVAARVVGSAMEAAAV